MAAWNPDEAQAAAIYLRLPDNDLLTIRSKDFAGRSAVWVPSKEEGYQKAILLDKKAEKDGQKGIGLIYHPATGFLRGIPSRDFEISHPEYI